MIGSLYFSESEFKEFGEFEIEILIDLVVKDEDKDDVLIIVYINKILMDVIKKGVLDLYFEFYEYWYCVCFWIDGILYEMVSLLNSLVSCLFVCIKVMLWLDIVEKCKF